MKPFSFDCSSLTARRFKNHPLFPYIWRRAETLRHAHFVRRFVSKRAIGSRPPRANPIGRLSCRSPVFLSLARDHMILSAAVGRPGSSAATSEVRARQNGARTLLTIKIHLGVGSCVDYQFPWKNKWSKSRSEEAAMLKKTVIFGPGGNVWISMRALRGQRFI